MEFKDEPTHEAFKETTLKLMELFLEEGHSEEDYRLAGTAIIAALCGCSAMREEKKKNETQK
jgi:hypothetical protein